MAPAKMIRFATGTREMGRASLIEKTRRLLSAGQVGNSPFIFAPEDTTAGAETELQAAVIGRKADVDLAQIIEQSNYLANTMRRTAAGDVSRKVVAELDRFLNDGRKNVWENSWVRFPRAVLNPYARDILKHDFLADKKNAAGGERSDIHRFCVDEGGVEFLRVPVSYLVRLSLADVIGGNGVHPLIHQTGAQLLDHFLSDNTSPETHSFYIVAGSREKGPGYGLARETAKRFLLTQLLVLYANQKFDLERNGQKAMIYFSPTLLSARRG